MSSAALSLKKLKAGVVFVMRMVVGPGFQQMTARLYKINPNVIFLAGSSSQTKVAVRLQRATHVATMGVAVPGLAMIFQTIGM